MRRPRRTLEKPRTRRGYAQPGARSRCHSSGTASPSQGLCVHRRSPLRSGLGVTRRSRLGRRTPRVSSSAGAGSLASGGLVWAWWATCRARHPEEGLAFASCWSCAGCAPRRTWAHRVYSTRHSPPHVLRRPPRASLLLLSWSRPLPLATPSAPPTFDGAPPSRSSRKDLPSCSH
eukprot:scaffold33211_cov33-Tisochrysis_lutea.AAC.6